MEMTLGEAFARSSRKFPDKIACIDDQARATYGQMNRAVNRWVHALAGLGLAKGAHVATLSDNRLELMQVILGNLKHGLITVPLDSRGIPEEVCHQAGFTDCVALFFDTAYQGLAEEIRSRVPAIETFVSFGGPGPAFALDYEELLKQGQDSDPPQVTNEDDESFILFTGGTTGRPKGAVLTHKSILWNIISVTTENQSPAPDERDFYPMQMYHVASLSRFLAFMYAGGTFIGSRAFDPDHFLDVVERERTTFVVGNPTIYKMLLRANQRRKRDTTSMRRWLNTHGVLDPAEREQIETDLWPRGAYYSSYALTEASPAVTILKPGDNPREWGSVGRGYMCTEVRLVDALDQEVETGETGEIVVKGPSVFKEYYKDPAETETALRGGWLHTGDLARFDDRGYMYMVDRIKDMIKTGGLNVYSREVEEVLLRHPEVHEVAVVGVPHPHWGESVCAVIVPQPGATLDAQSIQEHCAGSLAGYKKPTVIHYVEALPKTTFGGKVLKRELRKMFAGD
eukprot:TRINITY_DN33532_c0_g1_i1.p3 TRINITY_DN33532_c0_g1~~TRINITY_DN33532_c0_g1_i1.p3  ORF type:complete len:512 (+),score=175.97 TRINITY_DN33532_c0_g1_i1:1412-2947(+)